MIEDRNRGRYQAIAWTAGVQQHDQRHDRRDPHGRINGTIIPLVTGPSAYVVGS